MEIRQLRAEDFEDSMALFQYAFQYSLTAQQLEEQKARFRPYEIWGAFANNRLLAQVRVHDFSLYVNGERHRMGGVASVSTWPEQRRQGSVAKLLSAALQTMRETGQTVSALAPFSFPFYRKYGWELYVEYKKYTLDTAQLPRREETAGRVERLRQPDRDLALLSRMYDAYAARYNGMLVRTEDWWRNNVLPRKQGHTAVYYRADGEPSGYTLYKVEHNELTIHELVTLDEEGRRGLWTFLANHDSMIAKATLVAPQDDALPFLLADPRVKQEVVPYFMARIVDLKAFLAAYQFEPGPAETALSIQVLDPYAPWNEGSWDLHIGADGTARLNPCHPDTSQTPDVSCDIQTATAMLFGYRRPVELHAYGRLSATDDSVADLERRIPRRTTYLLDFF